MICLTQIMPRKIIIFMLALSLGFISSSGKSNSVESLFKFRVNRSDIDTSYCSETDIIAAIDSINNDSGLRITQVIFSSSSSPEGNRSFNRRLSEQRLRSAVGYVRSHADIPDSVIVTRSNVTDWDLLRSMVADSDMPGKDNVIAAIDSLPETVTTTGRSQSSPRIDRLKLLHGGKTWRYMLRDIFPTLRHTRVVVISEPVAREVTVKPADPVILPIVPGVIEEITEEVTEEPVDSVALTETSEPAETPAVEITTERKPFYMSLSTNMLYDALLVPNIGAEFYLGRNWSAAANWMYGWWDSNRRHNYWRIYGGDIALRRWFGPAAEHKPLTGHHVGIYVQTITYDFELGGKGQMAGEPGGSLWDKCSFGAGIEYGYSLPVSARFNIDFTIGVGYFGGTYYEYRPIDGHYVWQSTHRRNWIGPTRAMISLVWLLGHGNRNEKGGVR